MVVAVELDSSMAVGSLVEGAWGCMHSEEAFVIKTEVTPVVDIAEEDSWVLEVTVVAGNLHIDFVAFVMLDFNTRVLIAFKVLLDSSVANIGNSKYSVKLVETKLKCSKAVYLLRYQCYCCTHR